MSNTLDLQAPLFETKNLEKSYKSPLGKLSILKGVNFSLHAGELVFVLGRSGSGKSTLLHILGLLDKWDSGDVLYEGKSLKRLSEKKQAVIRNQKIGFVFQFYHLLPELSLLENVMLPGIIAGVRNKKNKAKAEELLDEVGLKDRLKHYPSQLSGGEQQRGALIRALMNDPDVILCDEPTGNLDEESSEQVSDLIIRLNREKKQTFCIVTHDTSFAAKGQTVYQLKSGQLIKNQF